MNAAWIEGLSEWMTALMYSGWFYAALGSIFFVIFICGMVWLFRRNENAPKAVTPGAQSDSSFDYTSLGAAAGKPNGRTRKILLAAGSLHDLPVTIPVNAGVQLAAVCKCLLIDLDTKRDALARVFEIAPAPCTAAPMPMPTPIENLHIWPAHYFSQLRQMDLKAVLSSAQQKYDVILLNAPYLATHPDRMQIVRCAESAVMFARDKQAAEALRQLLETGSCKILKTLNPSGRPMA